ncbi:MAG: hypothetical protein RLZZ350_2468 [Verrucomicrobiota bacterium]|jgi:hypothetical protein
MKTLFKTLLIALTSLTLTHAVHARGIYNTGAFNGSYYGSGGGNPLGKTELTINNSYLYGTAFPQTGGIYDYVTFYANNVDMTGNFTGYYYDRGYATKTAERVINTVSGHSYGSLLVLKFTGDTVNTTTILFKSYGTAPYFLAGREIDFYLNDGYSNYGYLYFYNNSVYYRHWVSGSPYTTGTTTYTYRVTGANSGSVTVPGVGTLSVNFSSSFRYGTGTLNGQSTYYTYMYDYGDDD